MSALFKGTFEAERKEDEVVYGLTHQLNSWNPVYTQAGTFTFESVLFANQ